MTPRRLPDRRRSRTGPHQTTAQAHWGAASARVLGVAATSSAPHRAAASRRPSRRSGRQAIRGSAVTATELEPGRKRERKADPRVPYLPPRGRTRETKNGRLGFLTRYRPLGGLEDYRLRSPSTPPQNTSASPYDARARRASTFAQCGTTSPSRKMDGSACGGRGRPIGRQQNPARTGARCRALTPPPLVVAPVRRRAASVERHDPRSAVLIQADGSGPGALPTADWCAVFAHCPPTLRARRAVPRPTATLLARATPPRSTAAGGVQLVRRRRRSRRRRTRQSPAAHPGVAGLARSRAPCRQPGEHQQRRISPSRRNWHDQSEGAGPRTTRPRSRFTPTAPPWTDILWPVRKSTRARSVRGASWLEQARGWRRNSPLTSVKMGRHQTRTKHRTRSNAGSGFPVSSPFLISNPA